MTKLLTKREQVKRLRNDREIVRIHDWACNKHGFGRDRESLPRVFTMAEHCIRVGEYPLTMFFRMITQGAKYPMPLRDWDEGWRRAKREIEQRKIAEYA